MKPSSISRSSLTINRLWKVRGRRPTLRRTCKVFIPRDLRELDTIRLPATYEEDPILVQKLKTFTKHKIHHCILVCAISFYIYAGALLFQYLESDCPIKKSIIVPEHREELLKTIYNISYHFLERLTEWNAMINESIKIHESKLLTTEDVTGDGWTIESSIFYCFTLITTIGYGNISPCTNAGRAVTSVYAALGVPLMFLVLADLGKMFTKIMKFLFRYFRRFYKTGTCREHSSSITENKPLQYMTVSWRTVRQDKLSKTSNDKTNRQKEAADPQNQVTTLTIHNDDLYKNLDFLNPDEKNHKHVEVEDEFHLPITLAIALDVAYMIAGSFLLSYYEEWTFFEAFYFIFISMTTIGLGDYAPQTQKYLMGAFIYLVLGLMLTSMCINVIQEKITSAFQKAKVRIGNDTVLNVSALLQDEDHRSRAPKLDPQVCNNCYAFKLTMHKNSTCSFTSNSITQNHIKKPRENSSRKFSDYQVKNDASKEMFLKVPFQNRFTFYDSPYNTVQQDYECTITSLRKYRL